MRVISYDEFVFKIKDTCYPIDDVVTAICKDKAILPLLIAYKKKQYSSLLYNMNIIEDSNILNYANSYSQFFCRSEDGIDALEVLFYEGIITMEDVINSFKSINIDTTEVYEKIYQYAVMYDYRKENPIFPFKLHIDTDFLKEKLKKTPEQYKVNDIKFRYDLDSFTSQDYDELMLYYREPSNMDEFKSAFLEDSVACVLGQKPDRRDDYPGFTQVWLLMYYLQIFIDDGLITNNQINKILSEVDITNIDWFMHIEEYLRTMLQLNKFKWHRYTLSIDVKMLQNKVEGAFNTPITEEGIGIDKNYFLNLYNILDSPLRFDKTPQERYEIDMFYREKYRKLYEAELKEKTNK